jgi:hypothetical protein
VKLALSIIAPVALVGALAMPGVASAKAAAPNPTTCTLSATVVFSTPLSVKGVVSAKGDTSTTTATTTLSDCTGGATPAGSTISIVSTASKPGKDSAAIAAGDSKTGYYLGLCGLFSADAAKSLGKAVKNLAVAGGKLTGAKASEGAVGSDVGFIVTGTVVGGPNPTAKNGASIMAGLTNDANNTNVTKDGCSNGPATGLDIDSSQSTATV